MNCVLGILFCFVPLQEPAPQKPDSPPQEAAGAQDEAPRPEEEQASKGPALGGPLGLPYGLRGYVDLKYIGRWTDGAHDHDLRGYGSIDFGDARSHLVSGHASGRLNLDMDRNRDPNHPFRGVDDTYSKDLTARLYEAWVDINGIADNPIGSAVKRVRLGRQIFYETPETLFLDGASLETAPCPEFGDLTLSAFVGVPNHIFEASPSQDLSVGAAATLSPWHGSRLRFDYVHINDEYLGIENKDDLFGLSGYQRIGTELFLSAHLNFLESDARDLGAHLTWTLPEDDLALTLRYYGLLSDQTRRSIDFDYFTPIEGTYYAYHQFDVFGHKGFAEHLYVDGGIQFRVLDDSGNEGQFNHDFARYYITPGVSDWPWSGVQLSLTAEVWDSGGDDFSAFGGDLSQKLCDCLTGAIGSHFFLYRYDVLADQEREDTQVYYVKLDYRATESLKIYGRFELETGDEDFGTLTLGARINF